MSNMTYLGIWIYVRDGVNSKSSLSQNTKLTCKYKHTSIYKITKETAH